MFLHLAADTVLVAHLLFILFVLFGGLLVLRWRWFAWLHLPTAAWGVVVELLHLQCPLTPLENSLRQAAGQAGYSAGFVYPTGLTPQVQWWLAALVLLLNGLIYGLVWLRLKRDD
jgi:hypothetical protein